MTESKADMSSNTSIPNKDEAIDLARYKRAGEEIETGKHNDALWYKAFAEGGGDEKATKAMYIRLRVEQLRRAADAASAMRITATQPSPAFAPVTPTVKPKGAENASNWLFRPQLVIPAVEPIPKGASKLYDVLGITPDADDELILAAYQKRLAMLNVQDNQETKTKNELIFIQHAKEVLLDKVKRAEYDERITAEAARSVETEQKNTTGRSQTVAPRDGRSNNQVPAIDDQNKKMAPVDRLLTWPNFLFIGVIFCNAIFFRYGTLPLYEGSLRFYVALAEAVGMGVLILPFALAYNLRGGNKSKIVYIAANILFVVMLMMASSQEKLERKDKYGVKGFGLNSSFFDDDGVAHIFEHDKISFAQSQAARLCSARDTDSDTSIGMKSFSG